MYSRAGGRPDCPASVFYAPAAYRRTALLREDAFEKGQRLKLFFCGGDFRLGLAGSSEDIAVLDWQRASIRMGPFGKTVGVVHDGPSAILAVQPEHLVDQFFLSRGEFAASRIAKQTNFIILRVGNELAPDLDGIGRRLIPDQIIDATQKRCLGEFAASRIAKQTNFIILRVGNELAPDLDGIGRRLIPDQIIDATHNRSDVHRDVTISGNRPSPPNEGFAIRQVKELYELYVAYPSTAKPQELGSGLSRLCLIKQQLHPATIRAIRLRNSIS